MHVIVVGCGRVGSELAVNLQQRGHSVAIIDKNARAFRNKLAEDWGGKEVVGYGFDRDHLEQAGAKEANALAAVTSGDNSNVISARIARETYQIANVVARIYDPRRAVIYQRLGIPTIATVTWTTDQVLRRLLPDSTTTEWSDPTGSVSLVERALPAHLAGRSLTSLMTGDAVRLVLFTRGGTARIATPDLIGQEDDILLLAVRRDALDTLDELFADTVSPGGHR